MPTLFSFAFKNIKRKPLRTGILVFAIALLASALVFSLSFVQRVNGSIRKSSERLGADLHEAVDELVRIARRHASAADRTKLIAAEMFDYFDRRLDAHGYTGDSARRHELIDDDMRLNAQGLDVWLKRRRN